MRTTIHLGAHLIILATMLLLLGCSKGKGSTTVIAPPTVSGDLDDTAGGGSSSQSRRPTSGSGNIWEHAPGGHAPSPVGGPVPMQQWECLYLDRDINQNQRDIPLASLATGVHAVVFEVGNHCTDVIAELYVVTPGTSTQLGCIHGDCHGRNFYIFQYERSVAFIQSPAAVPVGASLRVRVVSPVGFGSCSDSGYVQRAHVGAILLPLGRPLPPRACRFPEEQY